MESNSLDNHSKKFIPQNDLDLLNTSTESKLLCEHCGRTAINSAKCIGKCVADSGY